MLTAAQRITDSHRMLTNIKKIFSPLMDQSTSAAAIRDALAAIDPAAHEAAALQLEEQRRAALVAGTDADIQRLDEQIAAAWRAHERAIARRQALEQQLTEATAREEDTVRRERYTTADKQARDAAATFQREYPRAAETIISLLRGLAEADAAVHAANERLPLGAKPLAGAELLARGHAAVPRELVETSDAGFEWRYLPQLSGAVPPQFVPQIESHDGVNGVLRRFDGGWDRVRKVKLERMTYLEGVGEAMPLPLAAVLNLPPTRAGEAAFFAPCAANGYELAAIKSDPSKVLTAIDTLEANRQRPVTDPRPQRQRVNEVRAKE